MAEFRFYADATDRVALLTAVLSVPGNLVTPDAKYSQKKCPYYSSVTAELRASLKRTRRFFITGKFTLDGFSFSDVSLDDEQPRFVVNQELSHQSFSIRMPSSTRENGETSFGPGLLHLPREYFSDAGPIKPTEATKEAYAAVKRGIKRLMVSKKVQRNLILTPKAKTILEDENGVVLVDGWWLSGEGVKVRSNLEPGSPAAQARQ